MDEAPQPTACRLCGAPLPPGAQRCPACGLAVATDIPRHALRGLLAGLVAIYLFTALVLLLTR